MPEQAFNNYGITDEKTVIARIARANNFLDNPDDRVNLVRANCLATKICAAIGTGTIPCSNETFCLLQTFLIRLADSILDAALELAEEGSEQKAEEWAITVGHILLDESFKGLVDKQMLKLLELAKKLGYPVKTLINDNRTS